MKNGRTRFACRPGSLAALAAAGILAGCLENPGPDKNLYHRFNFYQFQTVLNGGRYLNLELERENGIIDLRAYPQDTVAADSAELYVYGSDNYDLTTESFYFFHLPQHSDFLFHGLYRQPEPVRDGQGDPVKVLLSSQRHTLRSDIRETYWEGTVLREWRGSTPLGHELGGLYHGTWRKWDARGKDHTGTLLGMIDSQGDYRFSFGSNSGTEEEDAWMVQTMSGKVNSQDYFVTYFVNANPAEGYYLHPAVTPRVSVQGDSLMVVFLFDKQDVADSLAMRCGRLSPSDSSLSF